MPIPSDPLLAQQWHLNNPNSDLLDLNVFGVWDPAGGGQSYTGAGTLVVVIDDGFDYNHSDFTNYDQSLDYDFEFNINDPLGDIWDAHGTAVAGIIGAAANGSGAVGIAFDATMVGYRPVGLISDAYLQDIRDAIYHSAVSALADVVNISQGIANLSSSEFGSGFNSLRFDEIEASIETAVDSGRGGLGTTIVKSAGNSRASNYDVNADDWTNDTRQVVVAAVNQDGFVSHYSSYGAAILVSGFGTPGEVVTTDRVGSAGYTGTDFHYGFNGTSSAAPMVAGVVALMYEAAPGLGWRDVQSILAASARHVGSEIGDAIAGFERYAWEWNASTTWNGGGMHFSNDYGYGLVDALAAVRLAETWLFGGQVAQVSGNEFSNTIDILNVATVIPDNNSTGRSFSGTVGFDDVVERVAVQITFSTTFVGDLEVYLISPDGVVSELISQTGRGADYNGTWTFESQAFRGERAGGTWSVRVVDSAIGDALVVSDIVITTFGTASTNDRYVFTNAYSDFAGLGGHLTAVTDTNGGVDTVNASAVSSNSVIRLNGLAGLIDGVAVSFANIEHAIGGDGSDQIYGNGGNNSLYGMRGNDLLDGMGGRDTLVGSVGNDTYVTDGGDTITENAGEGTDTVQSSVSFTLGTNLENLILTGTGNITGTGNALANILTGNAGNNLLSGGLGNDTLNGGAGNDTLNGSAGNDTMVGGAGNDIYLVSSTGDRVFETTTTTSTTDAGGIDTVQSSVTFSLDSSAGVRFVENLTLTGTGNITGTGNSLANILTGNAGNNLLRGGSGNDTLNGGAGNDTLNGGAGNDTMVGGAGNDVYLVSSTGDRVFETTTTTGTTNAGGIDTVQSSVTFSLDSSAGVRFVENLTLTGTGNINGTGNALANTIIGNSGANEINGGSGNDTLTGGSGSDSFVFNTALGSGNVDEITDFNVLADTIRLENAIFIGLAGGTLAASAFALNTSGNATDASDRIIYESDTGNLYFDRDGTGAAARVHFATLDTGLALTNADFFVF